MITLLTYPQAFGLFSSSPFCVKAAYLLRMSGIDWQREDMVDPRKMPFGKLPAIRTEIGQIIADSDAIRAYLEQAGACFEKGLSDLDRANGRAFIRMAEEHLYFHIVLDRWEDNAIWPEIRETYFSTIPKPLRGLIAGRLRQQVLSGLKTQGIGRLTKHDRLARIEPDLEAITTRLWQGPFLFGAQPTAADTSVAPMLAAILATPGKTPLQDLVRENDVLTAYVARVEATLSGSS